MLVLSPAEPPVWIEFETALSDDTPTSLIRTVESHVNTGGLNHTLELYNFDTGNYEIFSNAAATLKDTVLEITVNEEVSRFVESGTAVVRCRTAWKGAGPVGLYPWTVSFDEVSWTATH